MLTVYSKGCLNLKAATSEPINKHQRWAAGVWDLSEWQCSVSLSVCQSGVPAAFHRVAAARGWMCECAPLIGQCAPLPAGEHWAPYLSLLLLRFTFTSPWNTAGLSVTVSPLGLGIILTLFKAAALWKIPCIRSCSESSGTWIVVWLMLSKTLFWKTLHFHFWALMVRWSSFFLFFFLFSIERCCVLDTIIVRFFFYY